LIQSSSLFRVGKHMVRTCMKFRECMRANE
jgi:hypothetical protein